MQVSLSKNSEVPLHQQLAEQIVFLIATGGLRESAQLPSVRSLARRLGIHHNTVSKAYQNLVWRGWLTRKVGSHISVGAPGGAQTSIDDPSLDELINQSIQRARKLGYSVQSLRVRVRERLFAEAPDHVLLVEEELDLRRIIQVEIYSRLGKPVDTCTPEQLAKRPELAVAAQVAAPDYVLSLLKPLVPRNRPCIPLTFSGADEHIAFIRGLAKPSIIGVASVSETLLKTARSLLAPVLGQRHSLREFLFPPSGQDDLRGVDVAFCDSLTLPVVRCRNKIPYRLIAKECLEDLAAAFEPLA